MLQVENRERENLKVEVEDQGKIRFSVWVSFAEIYNEQIYDLLESMPKKNNSKRQTLKICDDRNGSPYVKGIYFNPTLIILFIDMGMLSIP